MPDQPADPIHYDMKIPAEPRNQDAEEHESAKKHGDKLDTGTGPSNKYSPRPDPRQEEKKGGA